VGYQAAENNTGANLTAIGYQTALNNTGNQVTAIGRDSAKTNTFDNVSALGYNSQPTKANQVMLGDTNVTEVSTYGDFSSLGDGKGLVLKTPDGLNSYRISIDNTGTIISTLI